MPFGVTNFKSFFLSPILNCFLLVEEFSCGNMVYVPQEPSFFYVLVVCISSHFPFYYITFLCHFLVNAFIDFFKLYLIKLSYGYPWHIFPNLLWRWFYAFVASKASPWDVMKIRCVKQLMAILVAAHKS